MVDEARRHRLFRRLEEVLGGEEAESLMEHLPPLGWADVATKHDLAQLQAATNREFAVVRGEMLELEKRLTLRMEGVEHRILSEIGRRLNRIYMTLAFTIPVSILAAVEIGLRAR